MCACVCVNDCIASTTVSCIGSAGVRCVRNYHKVGDTAAGGPLVPTNPAALPRLSHSFVFVSLGHSAVVGSSILCQEMGK